nr:nucleotide-binding alpha-beta plait domain-containing protein [Tanacetum cinerariifolium]
MGIFRTKEDEVSKISTSIFVSNFLDSFSSKYLFQACKKYGHVVDSFIPSKRVKDGQLKLNTNVARFNKENLKSSRIVDKTEKRLNKSRNNTFYKNVKNKDIGNSFMNVVKGSGMSLEMKSTPTIVLDDECLNTNVFFDG